MARIVNYPILVFFLTFVMLWIAMRIGRWIRKEKPTIAVDERGDLMVVQGASLTLLGLLIGFSFSMAVNRYDHRKGYEEDEANAIGTEYLRADVLPAADAEPARALLRRYLDERILFYESQDENAIPEINRKTEELQTEMWNSVKGPAGTQATAITALALSGMNEVLNSQGYTHAAWENRIPLAAWALLEIIGICAHLVIGYGAYRPQKTVLLLMLPLMISIAFCAISDIDSPRHGMIMVPPDNLIIVAASIRSH